MSGIVGHVGGRSGVIGQLTNPYINANTKSQSDYSDSGLQENLFLAGFKFLGHTSSGQTGVTLQSGACGIIIGSFNDGGSWNRRGFWYWKRCNGGTSYYDTVVEMHISGVGGSTAAMAISLDGSHVVTINVGHIWVYAQNG